MSGCISEFDSVPEHISSLLNYYSEIAMDSFNIQIPKDVILDAFEKTISHYYEHINTHKLPIAGVDPYKIMSWISIHFYEMCYKDDYELAKDLVKVAVACMRSFLNDEGKDLPQEFLNKLVNMVVLEFTENNQHLGLGQNGLYLAFRSASLCFNLDITEAED